MPDLFADIVPGVSAAGFFLNQSSNQFDEVIAKASRWNRSIIQLGQAVDTVEGWLLVDDFQLGSPDMECMKEKYLLKRRSLYFGKGAVKVHFDENGLIDLIVVGKGYKGSLNKDIRVGEELRFVSKHFEIEYDSVEELHFPVDEEIANRISFYAEEESLDDSPNQRIDRIFISRP